MAQYFIKIKESFLLSDIKDKNRLKEFPKYKKPIVNRFKEFTYDTFTISIYADTDSIVAKGPNKGKIIPVGIIYEFGPKQKTNKSAIFAISPKEKDIEVIIDGVFKFPVNSVYEERVQKNKFITFDGIKAYGDDGTSSYLEGEITSGTLEKPSNEVKKKYVYHGNENAKRLLSNYKISLFKDNLQ